MDRRERLDDLNVALLAAQRGNQAGIWTALPGIVESYDAAKRIVTVQFAIMAKVQSQDGTFTDATIPLSTEVPVCFPGGGGFVLTFPIKKGDEGICVFSARCIDAWWQQGGVQPQAEQRMHDLSDSMFIPGPMSQPQEITDVSADQVELRSFDGTKKLSTTATGWKMTGNLEVEGNISAGGTITWPEGEFGPGGAAIQGTVHATGNISSDSDVVAGGISGKTHIHPGVQTGGGNTGQPT